MSARTDKIASLEALVAGAKDIMAGGGIPPMELADWLLERELLKSMSDLDYDEAHGLAEEEVQQESDDRRTSAQKALHLADHILHEATLTDAQAMTLAAIYGQLAIAESIDAYVAHLDLALKPDPLVDYEHLSKKSKTGDDND